MTKSISPEILVRVKIVHRGDIQEISVPRRSTTAFIMRQVGFGYEAQTFLRAWNEQRDMLTPIQVVEPGQLIIMSHLNTGYPWRSAP